MEYRDEGRRRNEHKRRSRIYLEDSGSDEPRVKTGKAVAPREKETRPSLGNSRQGGAAGTPMKAPLPISAYNNSRGESPQISSYSTPNSRSREPTPTSRRQYEGHSRTGSKESQTRPRTRTLEERFREKSPETIVSGSRNRVGSLQSPPLQQEFDDDSTSIGFPSIIPSPGPETQASQRQRPAKSLSRPLSPIRNPIAAKPGTPLSSSSTDAKKILQLMKTTCGRMHGILSFRTSGSNTWASGYCAINVASGSLIYQTKGEVSLAKTLINDLRGCQVRTLYDAESRSTFLDVSTRRTSMGIHLRPHVPETFDSWLAALLCWQPIRPKGVQNKMTKPQEAHIAESKLGSKFDTRRPKSKDASIIKVGKMLMWDKDPRARLASPQPGNRRVSTYRPLKSMSRHWRKVSCTLQENGHFKMYAEPEGTLEAIVPLSQLSRCAIQRLDATVLDDEFSLAIYPQYASTNTPSTALQTIYLSLDTRVFFEVWFVLLRAFTVPELYGPESIPVDSNSGALDPANINPKPPNTDMFRVERQLALRIIEAKLHPPRPKGLLSSNGNTDERSASRKGNLSGNYYAEVQLDGEVRARTSIKSQTFTPFFREDFDFNDLPPVLSSSAIDLKTRNPGQKNWSLARATSDLERGNINPGSIEGDIQVSPFDLTYGTVDIRLDDLERATDTERWWPIVNEREEVVGEMLIKLRIEELVVLMGRDYSQISEMLHSFSSGLTSQLTQMAHIELKRLSDILLNIFQVSGHASAWLVSLVEEEIDTIHKETPMSKIRYDHRITAHDSYESSIEREVFVRDRGKNATIEANLLFRGNSLLTKALDSHMRRLGKEYLEETLGERMRDIEESDPDCEVDPHRVVNKDDLERNWRNLIALTENVWQAIVKSASRCPPDLRIIMRRIRGCAEDRYGGFLRTVAYSSVSGFLFLRFFCPAVLNPKLFGLLKDHPRARAQRTLTLITKTLQTLANLNTFGSKEPWMEPMNVFLTTHRPEFKSFIDEICSISSERATSAIPPSYATPITILGRLPGTSKEGFPSLPYLIDQARECASLVDVWLDARHEVDSGVDWSAELTKFDQFCEESREKSRQCLMRAEQAERPSGTLEPKWEELVEQMDRKARLKESNGGHSSPNTPAGEGSGSRTVNSSTSSIADSYFRHSHYPSRGSRAASRLGMTRSPVSSRSPLSADEPSTSEELTGSETTDTPPGSSSGVWDPGVAPVHKKLPPTASDIDDSDLDVENNSDILGSSIYSITPPKSKRDSSATNKTITPTKPNTPINSRWRHHQEKGSRSAYSLRRANERADISTTVGGNKVKKSGNGAGTEGGKSMYRLETDSHYAVADSGVSAATPRSPSEKKEKSVFGGVLFRKKGRDKEKEDDR